MPRGMTREDVNERMRRKRFLHTLKHGKKQVEEQNNAKEVYRKTKSP